ncbi:transposase [Mesorhizobium sp. M0244]|uniref:transposase n=1 Tax=Mesorhizobium sp. M0244 TaxID=2956926 RepID=UPI003335F598
MDIATDCRQVTRLEIVDTGRRRRWSEGEKLRIVEESYSAPRQASATARRHGISTPLLFAWRKAHREGRLGEGGVCGFVPAMIVPEQPEKGPEPAGAYSNDSGQ